MNNKHVLGVLTLLLLTSFGADAAKVYSWVDGNGITHYTDAPPPNKSAKEVDLRVAPLLGSSTPRSVQVDNFNSLTGADAKKEKKQPSWPSNFSPRNRQHAARQHRQHRLSGQYQSETTDPV